MSKEHPGEALIQLVDHPAGIVQGCKRCGTIHLRGRYVVGILIREDGQEHRYLLGFKVPMRCCGEEKPFYQVFHDRDECELVCEEVEEHLARHHETTGLRLISFRWVGSGAPPGDAAAKTTG